jgi:malonyl CoA-acyl carrier protein transacylase
LELTNDGKIKMNDGSYGSLIQIQKLVDKINAVENLLNGFIALYNSHTHVVVAAPGTSNTTLALENQNISPVTSVADIENDKITHGK